MQILEVEENDERLDQYLSNKLNISRSKIQKLIKQEKILVNNKVEKMSYLVKNKDKIKIDSELDFSIKVEAKKIKLDILYEDDYLMIINKQSGMVVHPAPGHYDDTLVNALLYHLNIKASSNIRVGIVHRLDKDTSGVMMVAKNDDVLEKLSIMIKNKEVKRHYLALVEGIIGPDSGTIDAPIGRDKNNREKMVVTDINSKEAITHFKVLKRYTKNTLIECVLDTGRTHQIRVHMAYIGHPIVNDPVYNKNCHDEFGQLLHSKSIEFVHPISGKKMYFEVEEPQEFKRVLNDLENKIL